MKRKSFYIFLLCEAALCMMLYLAREALPQVFTTLIAFPFEQIGILLRILSLSGFLGNVISVILYVAICLIPAFALFLLRKKRRLHAEDTLLAILSTVLLVVIYIMVNPGLLSTHIGNYYGQDIGKALLGGITYSIFIGYIVLRILRQFFSADTNRLQRYLIVLLYIINILLVYVVFGDRFGILLDSFDQLNAGNTGNTQNLGISYFFLVLEYLVNALPYILVILVVFDGLDLLGELSIDRYSEKTVTVAERLSRKCGLALKITVISSICFNLLQLVFFKKLLVVNGSVQIPLLSITFVLAALLLAQYIRENKQLKDDNDMFI